MLRQIVRLTQRLCPSGCQYWNRFVIASGGNFLAYCSTLAIYILDLRTFTIHNIIAAHEQTINCIAWSKVNTDLLASASTDCKLFVWSVMREQQVVTITLSSPLIMMEWSRFKEQELMLLHENGDLARFNISTQTSQFITNYMGLQPKLLRLHPSTVAAT